MGHEDYINHPPHYGGDTTYEVIKCLEAWGLDTNARLFNAVKYIARAGKKDDYVQDLRKAAWYLNREIEQTKWDGPNPQEPAHAD